MVFQCAIIFFLTYHSNLKLSSVLEKDDTLELVNALKEMIPSTISANIKETISAILAEENFKADAASKYVFRIVGSEHSTPAANSFKYVALIGLGENKYFFHLNIVK